MSFTSRNGRETGRKLQNGQQSALEAIKRQRAGGSALDAVTIEATGSIDKLEAFLNVLAPHGIKEIVQSGVVALARGGRSIADRSNKNSERSI